MISENDLKFYKKYGIEPSDRHWMQFNYAQVKRGLEIFPERKKLADEGQFKITCKMLNPKPENDCVYWEEWHYLPIDDHKLFYMLDFMIKHGITLEYDYDCNMYHLENSDNSMASYIFDWEEVHGKTLHEVLVLGYLRTTDYEEYDECYNYVREVWGVKKKEEVNV